MQGSPRAWRGGCYHSYRSDREMRTPDSSGDSHHGGSSVAASLRCVQILSVPAVAGLAGGL